MFNTLTSSHHCLVAADSLRLTWCTCSKFAVTTRTTCRHTAELLYYTCVTNFIVLIFGAPLLLSTHSSLAMIKHYFPASGNEFFPSERSSCFQSGFRCWFPLSGVWFFSHPFPFMVSFVLLSPFFPPLLSPLPPPLTTAKAPGDGRRALTIRLPQTRSTTRTRAPLNTNAPNLPQPPTARGVSRDLGLSRWSLCTRKAAPRTRRTTAARAKPTTAGPITALRLRGEENGFLPLGV